jgi:lysine N6-hydroxylase
VRIYAQNMGVYTHGIADPNLSLTAWRSAQIVNSLTGREVYRTKGSQSTIQWRVPAVAQQER